MTCTRFTRICTLLARSSTLSFWPADGVLTGSWDNSVRLWDPRKPGGEAVKLMAPAKVYSMSLAPEAGTIVVACADRKVATFDIRGAGAGGGAGAPAVAGAAAKVRDTALKHQLRCIRVMPDDEAGFIAGSIEGRCAVDFFSPDSGSAKPYTFKCHRVADPAAGAGEERIHPVNAIAFHPVHGTFATGESTHHQQSAVMSELCQARLAQFRPRQASCVVLSSTSSAFADSMRTALSAPRYRNRANMLSVSCRRRRRHGADVGLARQEAADPPARVRHLRLLPLLLSGRQQACYWRVLHVGAGRAAAPGGLDCGARDDGRRDQAQGIKHRHDALSRFPSI